jgi:leucyl/phenylalanyl-tRNA--protein transferase
MYGGELTPQRLLAAYRRGIFPWPLQDRWGHRLAWFSPDPRGILELDALHISRRLARRLRRGEFEVTFDRAFGQVMRECAAPRKAADGTWITAEMCAAYGHLHEMDAAHSVEVWQGGRLAGGLYGVAIGGCFSAESMFSRQTDASKIALAKLVERLRERNFQLCDVQVLTPHTASLGATEISRADFLLRLESALATATSLT